MKGLLGGHSGINIHEGRGEEWLCGCSAGGWRRIGTRPLAVVCHWQYVGLSCAPLMLPAPYPTGNAVSMAAAAVEAALVAAPAARLVTMQGGDKRNAIPRECSALLAVRAAWLRRGRAVVSAGERWRALRHWWCRRRQQSHGYAGTYSSSVLTAPSTSHPLPPPPTGPRGPGGGGAGRSRAEGRRLCPGVWAQGAGPQHRHGAGGAGPRHRPHPCRRPAPVRPAAHASARRGEEQPRGAGCGAQRAGWLL